MIGSKRLPTIEILKMEISTITCNKHWSKNHSYFLMTKLFFYPFSSKAMNQANQWSYNSYNFQYLFCKVWKFNRGVSNIETWINRILLPHIQNHVVIYDINPVVWRNMLCRALFCGNECACLLFGLRAFSCINLFTKSPHILK